MLNVCSTGCGNGKYLDVNRNVFSIGVDRCSRFTSMARDNGNEVIKAYNYFLDRLLFFIKRIIGNDVRQSVATVSR